MLSKLQIKIEHFAKFIDIYKKHTFFGYIIAVFLPIVIFIISLFFILMFFIIKNLYMGNSVSEYILIFIFDLIIICVLYILTANIVKKNRFILLCYFFAYIIFIIIFYKLFLLSTKSYSFEETLMAYFFWIIMLPPYISIILWGFFYNYYLYKSSTIDYKNYPRYQLIHTFLSVTMLIFWFFLSKMNY